MKIIAYFFSIFLVLFLFSCQNRHNSGNSEAQTYEDTKKSLSNQEAESPTSFLSVTGTYRKNLIGKTVIEGTVRNSASTTTFKDISVKVNFISQTGTVIGSDNYVIYEYVSPSNSVNFKLKIDAPQSTESVSIDLLNAQTN